MSTPHEAVLTLHPKVDEVRRLSDFLDGFAEDHALSAKDAHALHVAAEELFVNTVNHSQPPATWAELRLQLGGDSVCGTYTDDGGEHDTTSPGSPDTSQGADARRVGGLGVHLIRTMMRDFRYERVGGRNRTVFCRVLGSG